MFQLHFEVINIIIFNNQSSLIDKLILLMKIN